jgi:hypothetical protein
MDISPEMLLPCRVTLSLRQREALRQRAAQEGSSVSAVVRQAVDQFVAPPGAGTKETTRGK